MKAKLFVGTMLGLLVFSIQVRAQNIYQVQFRGTAQTTNDAGDIVARPINNNTLIQDAATKTGATNTQSLQLVYHINGTENSGTFGDTIEVLNTSTHTTIYTNFSFFSGSTFGQQLVNTDETQAVRLCDVFTPQATSLSGEDEGTALINQRAIMKNGQLKKLITSGTVLFFIAPEGTNGESICNATFNISKAIQ